LKFGKRDSRNSLFAFFPCHLPLETARRRSARTVQPRGAAASARMFQDFAMATTFERVADIIAETSEIERERITPDSNTIDDLGIDSLDFLDIVFAIDKEFGIKIPLEKWTQDVNDGKVAADEYFVMKNLVAKIDALIAAKA
jgi:acyl carrier protein